MADSGQLGGTVRSLGTMVRIVDTLQELDGGGVTEVADRADISKSTAHRHLSTLEANEFVTKSGQRYHLGYRLLELGGYVREQDPLWPDVKSNVDDLARETGERASFVVENDGLAIRIYIQTGENAVTTGVRIGKRTNLHQVSGGKAILAHLARSRVQEIISERGLPSQTPNTITDERELYDELDRIRERGYAIDAEESIQGLRCVGVPLLGPDDDPIGALSVAGPTHRMKGDWFDETVPNLLLGTANEIELKLKYS